MHSRPPSAHGSESGFVTITTVLVLIVVGLALALDLLAGATSATDAEIVRRDGLRAEWLADACAERVRAALRTPGYGGSEILELGGGTCEVVTFSQVATGSFEAGTLGRSGEAYARVLVAYDVAVDASGSATVTEVSWERVADF